LFVVVVLLIVYAAIPDSESIVQPIAFNHNLHIEQEGLECTDCHTRVESLPSATIPADEICTDCHVDEPLGESEEEVRLLRFIEEGNPIPWQRLYEMPRHVYFSHRRHVVLGEIECMTCHGDVPAMTTPPPRAVVAQTMEFCMDCHRDRMVTNDCLACHR
jgi:hypothetical protein